jgi:rod shape-determining protein MreC
MALGADRYGTRADTLLFLGCVAASLAAMAIPPAWREPFASVLRRTVLAPFLQLQQESELLRTSRARLEILISQRDSATLAATFLPELRSENGRLRALLGLGQRLSTGYISAEVLHQSSPTDAITFEVSAGRRQGVRPLAAVVSPEGIVGVVSTVDVNTSTVVTWAHPEFRASAMSADGGLYGIAQPQGTEGPGVWLLELHGVPYRQPVPVGTVILTSGMGGVFPRGIPIGTVIGVVGETEGWERTYLVRPAVHPAGVTHVMILGPARPGEDLHGAFAPPPDSVTAPPPAGGPTR